MPIFLLVGYFLVYSFIGWIGDTLVRSLSARHYATGSFFPVPLCPIYGVGALLVLFLHGFLGSSPIVLQGSVYGICLAVLEYATGMFVLTVFQRRLWSYADETAKTPRFTDFSHVLLWGLVAVVFVVSLHPYVEALARRLWIF